MTSALLAGDASSWRTARAAAHLLAVDPAGLGGAVLRGAPSPIRDAWLATLQAALPPEAPWRRMPANTAADRLLGGLDLAATLAAGRPVAERGLFEQTAGGVLLMPSAERLDPGIVALIGVALDANETAVGGDEPESRLPASFAAVLLDEAVGDEGVPARLVERVAFRLDLSDVAVSQTEAPPPPAEIARARLKTSRIVVEDAAVEGLCAAALACGVPSLRIACFALRAAKASAALAGREAVVAEDLKLAVALVIAPRATMLPAAQATEQPDEPAPEPAHEPEGAEPTAGEERDDAAGTSDLSETLVEAARTAIPADLLAELAGGLASGRRAASNGRARSARQTGTRGRPVGSRRGMPGGGARLALVDTLRAAAPWQRLRRSASSVKTLPSRILVRREDFRVARLKARSEAVTIFAVDASGSAALHRLAEVKGAVELILAECYVRRDQVALIAFRGAGADLILPPTRSLARAKRALAGQPGGGGTPLAAALDAAAQLADGVRRKGQLPLVVLMTDAKANIGRGGRPGRAGAEADAADAARAFRSSGVASLVLDIAPRPAEAARRLAAAMGARYVPLPYADAQLLSRTIIAAGAGDL